MSAPILFSDGLELRWATAADAEALAQFNYDMHNQNAGGVPEVWLKAWTHDLASGRHPTTGAGDFTIVVDESAGSRIVSSTVLISQTWRYAGRTFGCGRPELVATHPDYRRRGLIRAQMELLHARSAERGELVQAITGIPWFYRQFGYEMAIDLSGGRRLDLSSIPKITVGAEENFTLRQATVGDFEELQRLYECACSLSLVSCLRDEVIWRHELTRDGLENLRNLFMIETIDGGTAGYADLSGIGQLDIVRELAVFAGVSLREASLFLARWLKARLEAAKSTVSSIYMRLGTEHPLYEALAPELGASVHPYAWYVRVPDLPAFLKHIGPVLESRLADSPMAGYSGLLRLNFYTSHQALQFNSGKLTKIGIYQPQNYFDADAYFPDLSFLQLLFGYRSLEEIRRVRPDCLVERDHDEAAVLLRALFPTRSTQIIPLS